MLLTRKSIPFKIFCFIAAFSFFLSGCVSIDQKKYMLTELDPKKGIIVGTVFERAVFTPYGAYFYIQTPNGEQIVLFSGAKKGSYSIVNNPPKIPKGIGSTFALQVSPGKYRVTGWALDYGRANKSSTPPDIATEFEVEAGKTIYLGRFDANRFLEAASIHDNYAEDSVYLSKVPLIDHKGIENKALNLQGWWLPNAAGRDLLKK